MQTVYGAVHDRLGHINGETRSTPAAAMRPYQDDVAVDFDHNHQPVGRVLHLEHRGGSLWAVAEVDDAVDSGVAVAVGDQVVTVDRPLYWSSETIGDTDSGLLLQWLSLTHFPARVCPSPVTFLPGKADHRRVATDRWHLDGWQRDLVTRAAVNRCEHRHRQGLIVGDASVDDREKWLVGRRMDEPGVYAVAAQLAEDQLETRKRMRYSTPRRGSIINVR
jgi:hypothetical protein